MFPQRLPAFCGVPLSRKRETNEERLTRPHQPFSSPPHPRGHGFFRPAVSAGVNTWTTNGPEGGEIRRWRSTPRTRPRSTPAFGRRRLQEHQRRRQLDSHQHRHDRPKVGALAIDPSAPATLYAGTAGGGVFKSSNGGESWTAVGLANTYIHALAIDPSTTATVYAGTSRTPSSRATTGEKAGRPSTRSDHSVRLRPGHRSSAPATLYAGTFHGIFKSTDGGANWTFRFGCTAIDTLVIDPSAPSNIYAGSAPLEAPGRRLQEQRRRGDLAGRRSPPAARSLPWPSILLRRLRSTPGLSEGVFKTTSGGWGRHQRRPERHACLRPRGQKFDAAHGLCRQVGRGLQKRRRRVSWTAINAGLIAS